MHLITGGVTVLTFTLHFANSYLALFLPLPWPVLSFPKVRIGPVHSYPKVRIFTLADLVLTLAGPTLTLACPVLTLADPVLTLAGPVVCIAFY